MIQLSRLAIEQPALPWDTQWIDADGLGDWRVAPANDPLNPGGLKADSAIASAVIISLFTDRRAPDGWRPDITDRRGWWGDGLAREGEAVEPIGSWLWLLENEVAGQATAWRAKAYAEEALAWMVRERVAASVTVEGLYDPAIPRAIGLVVTIRDRAGALVFDRRFERLWNDVRR